MIKDDGEKTGESGTSTRATSVEPETETAPLLSSHSEEEPKTLRGLDAPITPDPPTEPLDRPTSPDVTLSQHLDGRAIGEDEYGAAVGANPPNASPPSLPCQPEARTSVLEEEEWEVRKIVGKRQAGKGYEYRVRWKDTWLRRSELGNARVEANGADRHVQKRMGDCRFVHKDVPIFLFEVITSTSLACYSKTTFQVVRIPLPSVKLSISLLQSGLGNAKRLL